MLLMGYRELRRTVQQGPLGARIAEGRFSYFSSALAAPTQKRFAKLMID
jgi:hypothetical protein